MEIIFGKSKEDYENIVSSYNAAPARDKPSMQWDYYEARMMDMAREGSWLIFCTFVAFVVYYVLLWSYKLLLRPFLSPFVFAIRECCCCCCSRRRTSAGDQSWDTCVQEMPQAQHSYLLSAQEQPFVPLGSSGHCAWRPSGTEAYLRSGRSRGGHTVRERLPDLCTSRGHQVAPP